MSAVERISFAHSELLRFIAAGSVDDGKSTLIGRLLHDSKCILEDQLVALERSSSRRGADGLDLSLLTDGLIAEREQGITIDVAHRYFATPKRKFIIADAPGHEQYTRNMVTAASKADLAVILVDARKGLVTQTRRHAAVVRLMGVPHVVLAVNKMDLVGYSQQAFETIRSEFQELAKVIGLANLAYVPISALTGEMVVTRCQELSWYRGQTLMEHLESAEVSNGHEHHALRFPVQGVCHPRDAEHRDFRGYTGRIESGSIAVGDEILVLPSGLNSRVKQIVTYDGESERAFTPQSITLVLEDEIDVGRGDIIVASHQSPVTTREFDASLCWLSHASWQPGKRYLIRHGTKTQKARVSEVHYVLDLNRLESDCASRVLAENAIAHVRVKTQNPIAIDPYHHNRATGAFILIDEVENHTVAAGLIGVEPLPTAAPLRIIHLAT
jgi:sulfate adenylyltransferase subunit 1